MRPPPLSAKEERNSKPYVILFFLQNSKKMFLKNVGKRTDLVTIDPLRHFSKYKSYISITLFGVNEIVN